MQPTPSPAPPAAAAPAAPTPQVLVGGTTLPVPTSRQELQGLRERRSMLGQQLESATERRDEVAAQLREAAPGADRQGLEDRLRTLDQRIVTIEQDIAQNSRAIAAAPPSLLASTEPPRPAGPPQPWQSREEIIIPITGMLSVFVFFPLAIAYARRLWKRPVAVPPPIPAETLARLERMEQALDTVAIEVERISEGQRFVTQLMSESRALGAGPAPTFAAQGAEGVSVPVGRTAR